jgi:hypothetical protein
MEGAEHPLADGALEFCRGHPPVQRVRGDEFDVVHPGCGGQLQNLLDHPLPDVRSAHLGQRQGQIVEDDGQSHPTAEQVWQRVAAVWVEQGVVDRAVDVDDARQRLRRVDHPAAQWKALQPKPLALVHQQRRSPLVDVEHETWSAHTLTCSCPPALRLSLTLNADCLFILDRGRRRP